MVSFYEHKHRDFTGEDCRNGNRRLSCAAHLHTHIEIVVMVEGETFCAADNECVTIGPGDVFLVFPNQVHRYETTGVERYFIFIVNPDLCPVLAEFFTGGHPTSAKLPGVAKDPEIIALCERLTRREEGSDPFTVAARKGYLQVLLARLLARTTLTTVPGDAHAVRAIVDYCTRNFTQDLSLPLLESELHISKYHISHLFSEKLHIGFHDYVNSLRVSYACRFLVQTDQTITEISNQVGFGTLRSFNRAFRRETGQTPSGYRRAAKVVERPAPGSPDGKSPGTG